MINHVSNLLSKSLSVTLSTLGTTGVGLFICVFGFGLVIWLTQCGINSRSPNSDGFLSEIKKSLRLYIYPNIALIFILLIIWLYFTMQLIYTDHFRIVGDNSALRERIANRLSNGPIIEVNGIVAHENVDESAILQFNIRVFNPGEPTTLTEWSLHIVNADDELVSSYLPGVPLLNGSFRFEPLDEVLRSPLGTQREAIGRLDFRISMNCQKLQSVLENKTTRYTISARNSFGGISSGTRVSGEWPTGSYKPAPCN